MPNPLLKRIAKNNLSSDMKKAWQKSMDLRGDATFFEVFANNPELYHWYINRFYKELFYANRIAQDIKELLRFRLSTLHGCKFCNQGNRKEALAAGISEEKINAINDFLNGPFSDKEKSVLQLVDEMALTNTYGQLTPELYRNLKHYFNDGTILELGMLMGILSGIAKFIFAFDLVEKEDNCPFHHNS